MCAQNSSFFRRSRRKMSKCCVQVPSETSHQAVFFRLHYIILHRNPCSHWLIIKRWPNNKYCIKYLKEFIYLWIAMVTLCFGPRGKAEVSHFSHQLKSCDGSCGTEMQHLSQNETFLNITCLKDFTQWARGNTLKVKQCWTEICLCGAE